MRNGAAAGSTLGFSEPVLSKIRATRAGYLPYAFHLSCTTPRAAMRRLSLAMIIFQVNGLFGHLPFPLWPFRFERYMTPHSLQKCMRSLRYAMPSLNIGAGEGGKAR